MSYDSKTGTETIYFYNVSAGEKILAQLRTELAKLPPKNNNNGGGNNNGGNNGGAKLPNEIKYVYQNNATKFTEKTANDGSLDGILEVTLEGVDQFKAQNAPQGKLVKDTHYQIRGAVPSGLTLKAQLQDNNKKVAITFEGNANPHTTQQNVTIKIVWQPAAFGSNADISKVTGAEKNIDIEFTD